MLLELSPSGAFMVAAVEADALALAPFFLACLGGTIISIFEQKQSLAPKNAYFQNILWLAAFLCHNNN